MNVTMLTRTPDPLRVLFTAAHTCYSPKTAAEIWRLTGDETSGHDDARMLRTVRGCIARGHNSVIRHVGFTFSVDGISRACANQLTRHGPGWAFDQQSLRYVRLDVEPDWVLPGHLPDGQQLGIALAAGAAYDEYVGLVSIGVKPEDARSVLPLCTPTNLVATANLAALFHFWAVRCKGTTGKPQDEIKDLAARMVMLVVEAEPWLGEFFETPRAGG